MKISHDSETPAHGQQVITACAVIHHQFNGVIKVFLPKRAVGKKFLPDVYEIPGGHIDYGEHIEGGLRREIHEELEVDIVVGEPIYVFDYLNPIKGAHAVEIVYLCSLVGEPEAIRLHPDDHSTGDWFGRDDLDVILTAQKDADDPEFQALIRAFEHLGVS